MAKIRTKEQFKSIVNSNPVMSSSCKTKCHLCLRKLDPTNFNQYSLTSSFLDFVSERHHWSSVSLITGQKHKLFFCFLNWSPSTLLLCIGVAVLSVVISKRVHHTVSSVSSACRGIEREGKGEGSREKEEEKYKCVGV